MSKYAGMIQRNISENIESKLFKGKILILLGTRQVGKTTLLKQFINNKKRLFMTE